mmetsp:Transcript_860/g.1048  ORF Transcript_860/g.1048 Transcript_860/m.1048 type:complete len:317 (+) Transcript_860:61-1011(+)|eukprot:CAMPEP_0194149972 /NCGR_PEP_ID=MMETSP0152-20130528/40816_1 /TAXON_ID=1049557 /ORGANISM="Thalassiothrix antarctica, Strain L6-D1" /LENGTH=316 /DNA_ID=CAMNT_0038852555 /DNA_START=3 /DNA_END=953 /DNA_ORIENTATION=+
MATTTLIVTLFLCIVQGRTVFSFSIHEYANTNSGLFRRNDEETLSSMPRMFRKERFPKNYRRYESSLSRLKAIREATFGMGCFWEPSESMLEVEGVLDSVVGYAGGSLSNVKPAKPPSYDDVCYSEAWVEAVRVVYDDDIIPYEKLLDKFFLLQKPVPGSRQYASIIFPEDDIQNNNAQNWLQSSKDTARENDGLPVSIVAIEYNDATTQTKASSSTTGVLFYRAEEYHQRYWLKWRPRIVTAIFLLTISSGLLAPILSVDMESKVKITSSLLFIIGALYYGIIERIFDNSVRELLPGFFATDVALQKKEESEIKF